MKPGGLVVVIAGIWLGCQVFGGNMLERLGIIYKDGGGPPIVYPGSTKPAVATATPSGPLMPA